MTTSKAAPKRKSYPIPDPPADFDAALGCYGPGPGGKRCGGDIFAKGCCYTHYGHLRWLGELRIPHPREKKRSGHHAHGLFWSSKKAADTVAREAKKANKSVNEFIVDRVERSLGLRKEEE